MPVQPLHVVPASVHTCVKVLRHVDTIIANCGGFRCSCLVLCSAETRRTYALCWVHEECATHQYLTS